MFNFRNLIIAAFTCLSIIAYTKFSEVKPNIIIITADDLGIGRFNIALNNLDTTGFVEELTIRDSSEYTLYQNLKDSRMSISFLSRMAKEGAYFTNAYAASPWCSPSRLALLTSQYPQRCKTWSSSDITTSSATNHSFFLSEIFQNRGYKTGIIGKWHLSNNYIVGRKKEQFPIRKGFDYYWGFDNSGSLYYDGQDLESNDQQEKANGFLTGQLLDKAIEFIEQNKNSQFFLYLPFNAPHGPLNLAPKEYYNLFDHDNTRHLNDTINHMVRDDHSRNVNYHAHVKALDHNIEKLIDYLKRSDLSKNTIIVFTSDHGAPGFDGIPLPGNSPFKGYKGQLYDGALKVPLIFWTEGDFIKKRKYDHLVSQMDILPTCLQFCGIDVSTNLQLDGKDIFKLISTNNLKNLNAIHNNLVWAGESSNRQGLRDDTTEIYNDAHWIITNNEFKLRYIEKEGLFLYDLKDYDESSNLITSHPYLAYSLHQEYASWYETIAKVPYVNPQLYNKLNPVLSKTYLRDLGVNK